LRVRLRLRVRTRARRGRRPERARGERTARAHDFVRAVDVVSRGHGVAETKDDVAGETATATGRWRPRVRDVDVDDAARARTVGAMGDVGVGVGDGDGVVVGGAATHRALLGARWMAEPGETIDAVNVGGGVGVGGMGVEGIDGVLEVRVVVVVVVVVEHDGERRDARASPSEDGARAVTVRLLVVSSTWSARTGTTAARGRAFKAFEGTIVRLCIKIYSASSSVPPAARDATRLQVGGAHFRERARFAFQSL
jgi:hypothetical protein